MVKVLARQYPEFTFVADDLFAWSPDDHSIRYNPDVLDQEPGTLALLHELAHGLLGHQDFAFDIELLQMEIEAWQVARRLAGKFKVPVDEEYIHFCLESYREWLYKRSRCPKCNEAGVQQFDCYHCFICGKRWRVTANRHTHPYRKMLQ